MDVSLSLTPFPLSSIPLSSATEPGVTQVKKPFKLPKPGAARPLVVAPVAAPVRKLPKPLPKPAPAKVSITAALSKLSLEEAKEDSSDESASESESESDSDSDMSSASSSDESADEGPRSDPGFTPIPLKYEGHFSAPNEFGVRIRSKIECDGKCNKEDIKDGKCLCLVSEGRGKITPIALQEHQVLACKWMIEREANTISQVRGGINASEMGLGKSLETLVVIMRDYALPNPPEFPTLVICPFIAITTWKEEIEKFLGSSCPFLIVRRDEMSTDEYAGLSVAELRKYRIVITNYDTIRVVAKKHRLPERQFEIAYEKKVGINEACKPSERDMKKRGDISLFTTPWHRIVADEGHNMNNCKAQVFYSMMCLYSTRKWTLTGTPLRNYSKDLFSQFRFLGFNKVIVAKQFTLKLYSDARLDKCILYMTKEDAGIKLPPCTVHEVSITLTGREKEVYDYFQKATIEAYNGFMLRSVSFANVLTLFLRLRQCCVSAYTVCKESSRDYKPDNEEKEAYTVAQEVLDRMTAGLSSWMGEVEGTAGTESAKISRTMEILRAVPEGEKAIVFTNFKKVVDVLEKAFKTEFPDELYEIIDGDVTGEDRANALKRFKQGTAKVLFITYKVGSESLNLTEANHNILMETVWTPAVEQQAAARSHRVGQEKEVHVYKMVCKGTIEDKMLAICNRKKDLFEQFITSKKKGEIKMDAEMMRRIIM